MGPESDLLPISAVIISKNAEATIGATLRSLRRFAEVVVYDNGSEDPTMEVARGFPNVSLHQGNFFGFGPTKNHAADLAQHDWVFSIDSDERISPELLDSIAHADLSDPRIGYRVLRMNYLRGTRQVFRLERRLVASTVQQKGHLPERCDGSRDRVTPRRGPHF